jgi:hypothetical protein
LLASKLIPSRTWSRCITLSCSCAIQTQATSILILLIDFTDEGPSNSPVIMTISPTWRASCRCFSSANLPRGTRGSRLCGGDHDRETKNSKVCAKTRDTRFIQVQAAKVANPTSCLGYQVWRPALGVGLSCPARYPALLYIVQGAGS